MEVSSLTYARDVIVFAAGRIVARFSSVFDIIVCGSERRASVLVAQIIIPIDYDLPQLVADKLERNKIN